MISNQEKFSYFNTLILQYSNIPTFQQSIMSLSLRTSGKGFTLIEMMIVITIILSLVGLVLFPYSYYMERAYVERSIDEVGQNWILAHKEIRNGKIFSGSKNANTLLIFEKGSHEIKKYFLSWNTIPDPIETSTDIISANSIILDSQIEILSFSGAWISESDTKVGYLIMAPFATGAFFTGSNSPFSSTGIFLTIGYTGAELTAGRARQILLRPYLQ